MTTITNYQLINLPMRKAAFKRAANKKAYKEALIPASKLPKQIIVDGIRYNSVEDFLLTYEGDKSLAVFGEHDPLSVVISRLSSWRSPTYCYQGIDPQTYKRFPLKYTAAAKTGDHPSLTLVKRKHK